MSNHTGPVLVRGVKSALSHLAKNLKDFALNLVFQSENFSGQKEFIRSSKGFGIL